MKLSVILPVLGALLLSACSTKPFDPNWRPNLRNADLGTYPSNYIEVVKKWGNKHFPNSKAVRYLTFSQPQPEYIVTNANKQQAKYGYSICADISGLKSDGYYRPIQKHWFFIRNGKVLEHRDLQQSYQRVIYQDHQIQCH